MLTVYTFTVESTSFTFTTQSGFTMLKFTPLALGLLTVIAIAPASQAATTLHPVSLQQPTGDLHSQVILKIGGQPEYHHREEAARRRELEREREREREAARRRHQYYSHHHSREYHGEYRHDR
jgi:hypothetical protein